MLNRALNHLSNLVAADTTNPPRAITGDHPIFRYVGARLREAGCAVSVTDLGDGSVNLLAKRGAPTIVVNCHLDTAPADPSWSRDPFALHVESDRAIGIGACDIKGAAACALAAAELTTGDAAILFSSDEEAGPSRCVRAYLDSPLEGVRAILVSEPTECRAVVEHRGLATCEVEFLGASGHSSGAMDRGRSATHHAVRFCAAALDLFDDRTRTTDDHRFNIGVVRGGTKSNMIASSATVHFGLRPPASSPLEVPLEKLHSLLPSEVETRWKPRFLAPGLPRRAEAVALAQQLQLQLSPPVDYWTEAALFTDGGVPAIVFGPGSIAQAHTGDEFVTLGQLRSALTRYIRLFQGADSYE